MIVILLPHLVNEEKTILILKLTEPAYLLAPFCPEANESYVKIVFARKYHSQLTRGLEKLFGHVKYVELPISSPSISSSPARLGGKASAAISPLTVHNTLSSQTIRTSLDEEKRNSDKTVSSPSEMEEKNPQKKQQQLNGKETLTEKNYDKVCVNVPDEKPMLKPTVVAATQEKLLQEDSTAQKQKCKDAPANNKGRVDKRDGKVESSDGKVESSDGTAEPHVDFEIENRKDEIPEEKEASKNTNSRKKVGI